MILISSSRSDPDHGKINNLAEGRNEILHAALGSIEFIKFSELGNTEALLL